MNKKYKRVWIGIIILFGILTLLDLIRWWQKGFLDWASLGKDTGMLILAVRFIIDRSKERLSEFLIYSAFVIIALSVIVELIFS